MILQSKTNFISLASTNTLLMIYWEKDIAAKFMKESKLIILVKNMQLKLLNSKDLLGKTDRCYRNR
jgi:pyruvate-formate lyase